MSTFDFDDFLADSDAQEIDWMRPPGAPAALETIRISIGLGPDALEVVTAKSTGAPKMDDVRRLWSLRWNRRAAPVLLVVAHENASGWEATVCGPSADPTAIPGLELSKVDRICSAALSEPTAAAAKRTLQRLLVSPQDQLVAGLTNKGLFASHELRHGVPTRADWPTARTAGTALLTKTGTDLIAGLGYTPSAHGSLAQILSVGSTRHAVAVLLNENELFDRPGQRFGAVSPVTQGLAIAQEQNLPWLIVIRGTLLRLYPAKPDIGVGRKGQSETYVELDLATVSNDDAGYLPLLFSPDALAEGGTVGQILAASADHAAALGARLRDRVYVDVVPALAVAVANAMQAAEGVDLDERDLQEAYHRTLVILFRLLFVSYAEDRGLLPYGRNPRYTKKALKTLAREFATNPDIAFDAEATDRWEDLLSVWRAVDDGNSEWDVPPYNGGLFATDADLHPSGHAIAQMRLTNAEIGPALKALLIDRGADEDLGPVDFRSLSVREFGTIYEGLLESSLSIAPTDLTVDAKTRAFLPAKASDHVEVRAGQVYFHNASGARKATGSYFTKAFAVEHLLDTALESALTDHLAKVKTLLDAGDEAAAADAFFDFRIADLAMGSGHFLVAAIDRIETRFAKFLADNPIPNINDELTRLSIAAEEALGEAAGTVEIETAMLLRRQIARRCIYGLDLNLIAVELARLAIWIHTFVPGLPMSSLDHGLRVGNSLTGIGTVDEALAVFEPRASAGQFSLFGDQIEEALKTARDRLMRVARTAEATKAEVREATRAHAQAMDDAGDARALLDAAVAVRLGLCPIPSGPDEAIAVGESSPVQLAVRKLKAAHLPYLFPEVFMRVNGGFDAILGNPPWEKVKVEEHRFWGLRHPGLLSLSNKSMWEEIDRLKLEREDLAAEYLEEAEATQGLRRLIAAGPFPGLGSGDIDLYQAFCWRDWDLLRDGGRAGIVFPRSALSGSGTAMWRKAVVDGGSFENVCTLVNSQQWVFDEVHPQYTVSLTTVRKGGTERSVTLEGPYHSAREMAAGSGNTITIPSQEFAGWTTGHAFPMLPGVDAVRIFRAMRSHPRLDTATSNFEFRPVAELHASADKHLFDMDLACPAGDIKVYKGVSFDIWQPDGGTYYGYADPAVVLPALLAKRQRQARSARSALHGMSAGTIQSLDALRPRIAFRNVTRSTDSRTFRGALVPPNVVLTHGAPYFVRREGGAPEEAYLLGILSSIPLDWYARRVVELNMVFEILNGFPIPRPSHDNPLRVRLTELSGRLAAIDGRYAAWAEEVGVPVGSVTTDATKNELIAEIDALSSLLYGLQRADVEHMFMTFHRGWNYQPRLEAVLAHYDAWESKGDAQ
ncbi:MULTISPECIES: Eco57I restriction-modification methylase domain-containing protein [unclassified Nocardioides]|uniref:Eco57I restriction-modification methylase domain-containing protein n=1 Tax=unclassified Nocardioides TaxID=2615069 RepID=UPI0030151250